MSITPQLKKKGYFLVPLLPPNIDVIFWPGLSQQSLSASSASKLCLFQGIFQPATRESILKLKHDLVTLLLKIPHWQLTDYETISAAAWFRPASFFSPWSWQALSSFSDFSSQKLLYPPLWYHSQKFTKLAMISLCVSYLLDWELLKGKSRVIYRCSPSRKNGALSISFIQERQMRVDNRPIRRLLQSSRKEMTKG